ncbi:hypothetical protein CDD81_6643 [Ophiocordyceps australis]|uniref:Zn(2)-C6 fungal-type domain-containing protein n=1 Tax=Ophiocordyceps australis TaxID=1399860 RepID=A0A2C5Y5E5_9HYPO|nr:hypothetical protein CDD81_6643 [Ophiocordyceps australis]
MGPNSVIPRACHNCRVRKIRCNRENPCSNCITSSLVCQPNSASAARVAIPASRFIITAASAPLHTIPI